MRGKILFATGLAVGYVLGTRAGRERYEELKRAANGFWNDPRVQHRFDQVEDFVKEKAPEVAEFVSDGAKQVVNQVTGHKASRKKAASSGSGSASNTTTKKAKSATTKKAAAKKPSAASSGSSS